ncbi:hypothetical protein [Roseicella aquatilis]|uniref:Chromosome partitioning protein ParB n=1 Tax=Roseicella aquatilis TaxID=2527868 RepID=A0A4R4DUU6_9PROT|nr:hypothetical protein [Roseicella aquatilis]TCZ66043.1 hypothetical protein EXY23_02870 [Roseicella aquatilis]
MEVASPIRAEQPSRGASSAEGKEPLQVRIPTSVKRRFKAHAALRGLEPHALFVEIWEHYEARLRSGDSPEGAS